MNNCLLVKWIWKLVNREDSLWCRLMYEEYMKKDFFSTKGVRDHSFGGGFIWPNTFLGGGNAQSWK
jgi:hypothetical protein